VCVYYNWSNCNEQRFNDMKLRTKSMCRPEQNYVTLIAPKAATPFFVKKGKADSGTDTAKMRLDSRS